MKDIRFRSELAFVVLIVRIVDRCQIENNRNWSKFDIKLTSVIEIFV